MRPVRLTMQALGPYVARETVDFREAVAAGLFGIYGPTGAGKSSIFNAMTFALFGEATRKEQETASLRSGHADPAMLTEVEFVFDIGDRTYLVRRRPDQMRPKQRGTGETRMAHEAWLFDVSGLALETLLETNTGKIIAEKKVNEVETAITALLGYSAAQFRQIVLLPQGKFEAFLAADTKDRLKILRQLFDVSIYQNLAERFRADAKSAIEQLKTASAVCSQRVQSEGFDSPEALAGGIADAQALHADRVQDERAAAETVAATRAALDAARQCEALFVTAEKAATALLALRARDADIQLLNTRLANARRAEKLGDVERQWHSETLAVAAALRKRDDATLRARAAGAAARSAAAALESEQARAVEIDSLRTRGEDLERHLATLASAAGLEEIARTAHAALAELTQRHASAVEQAGALQAHRRQRDAGLRIAREHQTGRQALGAEQLGLTAAHTAAQAHDKAARDCASAEAAALRCRAAHGGAVDLATGAAARFAAAEADLSKVQALHLATKLVPGQPCPVCGGLDHPAPAHGTAGQAGFDKAFRDTRAALQQAQAKAQEAGHALASAEATWHERSAHLAALPVPEQSVAELQRQITELAARIAALGPAADIAAEEARLTGLEADLVAAETAREALRAALDLAVGDEALARGRWQSALEAVPAPLRQRETLERERAGARRELASRQAALDAAIQHATAARETALGAGKDAEAAGMAHAESEQRLAGARTTFAERLAASGLSDQDYATFKPLIARIEADQATVDAHARQLSLAHHHDEAARQAIAGSTRPDLPLAGGALEAAARALAQATHLRAEADFRCQQLQKLQQEIADALQQLAQLGAQTAPLRELAGQFNADNPYSLDLETFAIGEMFTQVLDAANLRFGPMTSGRYLFQRASEDTNGRSRRGLGIGIFDVHTGKSRAPATLSGGETFIAALALALGLSDVVESMSGHVRLDTIFIDEGFGSLDTEARTGTLDQVLDVLRTLVSQNRAVGLISHVPQVQEAIPNGFYVRKEARGSQIERRA